MAKKRSCTPEFEGKRYELLDCWVDPYVITCDVIETRSAKVYYSYTVSEVDTDNNCEVVTEHKIGVVDGVMVSCFMDGRTPTEEMKLVDTIQVNLYDDDGDYVTSAATFTYKCKSCEDWCEDNISVEIRAIILDKEFVTCLGGNVNYSIQYVVKHTDRNCNITPNYYEYIASEPWVISPCTGGGECCEDHIVTEDFLFKYNKQTGSFTPYDGGEISDNYITFKEDFQILMKGDNGNMNRKARSSACPCKPTSSETTYCIDDESVSIVYPGGGSKVPSTGGVVTISFSYYWYVTVTDCDGVESELTGTDTYTDYVYISPFDCTNPDAKETIEVYINFKEPHKEGCNTTTITLTQEKCSIK